MTKAKLDKQLQELRIGAAEVAAELGYMGAGEAFDIASGFISEPGVAEAIKKYYGVDNTQEFVANYIA